MVVGRQHGIGMTSQRTRQRLVQRLREAGIRNEAVLAAMLETPRHLFVDEALASRAYEDTALPIGFGQTISQPYVVARMTELLLDGGKPMRRVLEIGTGSGYQTAVLARLVDTVYSVERLEALVDRARRLIRGSGLRNTRLRHGDGYAGWDYHAPFDGILITAAPPDVPRVLLDQLAEGGRLVAPVGNASTQELVLVERVTLGFRERRIEPVSFVPLLGGVL